MKISKEKNMVTSISELYNPVIINAVGGCIINCMRTR